VWKETALRLKKPSKKLTMKSGPANAFQRQERRRSLRNVEGSMTDWTSRDRLLRKKGFHQPLLIEEVDESNMKSRQAEGSSVNRVLSFISLLPASS